MSSAPVSPPSQVGSVRAILLATLVQISINAVVVASAEERVPEAVRGSQIVRDAGEHLALSLIVVGLLTAWQRFVAPRVRRPWIGWAVLAATLVLLAFPTVGEDAAGFSTRAGSSAVQWALWLAMVLGVALAVPLAALGGGWMTRRRRWLAVLPALGGVLALIGNHLVLEDDYPWAHLYLVLAGIAAITGGLAALPLPRWWPRLIQGLPWAAAAGLALFAVAVPPSNAVQIELLKVEGSVVAPVLARLRASQSVVGKFKLPPKWKPWFAARDAVPPVPPTSPPLLAGPPVVVLVTIDSWRADVMLKGKHDKDLPQLARLRDDSVFFTMARAPGSQTVYSLAEMFAGTYYSQQYWSKWPDSGDLWPSEDATRRFPELLAEAGVPTATYASTKWLVNEFGVVRGFTEEEFVKPKKTRYAVSSEQMPKVIARLDAAAQASAPVFIYVHLLDAHFTVRPAGGKVRGFKRYIENLKLVDEQMGLLRARLEQADLADRALLIVSSDHGEAFGEHGVQNHRHNLYEELLRVPMMFFGRSLKARKLDTPVSLIDLGPTVLDVFGRETPNYYMGESLVTLLRTGKAELTRPLLAEGRLKKALIFPDQLKAIVDDRNHTSEVYNLKADPKEATNLIDSLDVGATERISALRKFFEVHQLRRPGYKPPYRP